jgi:mannose-6-phosphate isomerase-like protein (cupin superfamily)
MMDRREFAGLMPALLACVAVGAEAQQPAGERLKTLESGTFKPGAGSSPQAGRTSHRFLMGMLTAGNIRLEMHETTQEPGAPHEPVGTHLHNEIWMVREGRAELSINGVSHFMDAGDVGLVTAGDKHWIKNAGDGRLAYFVVAVGPPEEGGQVMPVGVK